MLEILNDEAKEELPRHYLGLSAVGEECHRKLQYDHYWAYKNSVTARIQRLFNVGHQAEDLMIADLAKVGIIVTIRQEEVIGTAGHWMGHTDGRAHFEGQDTPDFLVEFKTHNDKNFKDLVKKQVKISKPAHYDQMTAYMGYTGLMLGLYMALNKNTSEYYIEWIEFDEDRFKELKRKEFEVLSAESLLPKIGTGTSSWFKCKMCSAKEVCHNAATPVRSCRTCQHCDVHPEGNWRCSLDSKFLSIDEQVSGCHSYKLDVMFNEG